MEILILILETIIDTEIGQNRDVQNVKIYCLSILTKFSHDCLYDECLKYCPKFRIFFPIFQELIILFEKGNLT